MTFAAPLFAPFTVFVSQPLLALVPAALFAALYRASRRRLVDAAAVAWLCYACYEYAMHRRWLCSGECNIRIDLLLPQPMLWLVSLVAAVAGIIGIRGRRNPKPGV